jgi:mercuric ion transport protein
MDRLKGAGLVALAVVACPCHLPVLLAVLSGTTIGALLAANVLPVVVVLGVVFVGALMLGVRVLETGSGSTCAPHESQKTP